MTPLFKKLNLKQQNPIHVLNAPEGFDRELEHLDGVTVRKRVTTKSTVSFGLAFAITTAELDKVSRALVDSAEGDAVIWIAYPKKSSKKYSCEFNRDSGWQLLGDAGYEGVRMVAIDEDWSALRFRRAEYIKSMKRSSKMAISDAGRKRTR